MRTLRSAQINIGKGLERESSHMKFTTPTQQQPGFVRQLSRLYLLGCAGKGHGHNVHNFIWGHVKVFVLVVNVVAVNVVARQLHTTIDRFQGESTVRSGRPQCISLPLCASTAPPRLVPYL